MSGPTLLLYRALMVGTVVAALFAVQARMDGVTTEDDWVRFWSSAGLAAFLGLLTATLAVADRWERGQREKIRRVAERLGLHFAADGAVLLGTGLLDVERFANLRPRATNTLHAMRGKFGAFDDVCVFDFAQTRRSGSTTVSYRCTVAAFRLPRPLPVAFSFQPAKIGDRAMAHLRGKAPVPLPHDPRFSRSYLVYTDDPEALPDVVSGDFRRALEIDPQWSVDAAGEWLGLWKFNKPPRPDDYPAYLTEAERLASRFVSAGA